MYSFYSLTFLQSMIFLAFVRSFVRLLNQVESICRRLSKAKNEAVSSVIQKKKTAVEYHIRMMVIVG